MSFVFAPLAEENQKPSADMLIKMTRLNAAQETCRSDSSESIKIFSMSGCTIYCRQRQLHTDSHCCWLTAGSYDTGGRPASVLNVYHVTVRARTISLLCLLCISTVTCNNNEQLQSIASIKISCYNVQGAVAIQLSKS